MEPRIQYAKTEDGVNIAYWSVGEGDALVVMPPGPLSHIQLEWQWPEWRYFYERLSERRKLIRYDGRGTGLSEREVTEYSLDTRMLDLEAVTERLGLERFALWGHGDSGPVAITYAARWPQRVSHLTLWCTWAKSSDPPWTQAMDELIKRDWQMGSETLAHGVLGWSGEEARRLAALIRECSTPEGLIVCLNAGNDFDATDLLTLVRSPTLVLHRRQISFPDVNVARFLASEISDARLALLEGNEILPFLGDVEPVLQAIDEFLRGPEEATPDPPAAGAVHTILFTDMESSTALTQSLGDAKAQELVRAHNSIVREALTANEGSEIKHTGDGIMASFGTASSALACAVAIQRAVAARAGEQPEIPLGLRIGLNAGEPVAEEQDLFGASVQLAKRICDHAKPGQVLASNVVRELAMGKGFLFGDIGDVVPKGFEEPVRLYEVSWRVDG